MIRRPTRAEQMTGRQALALAQHEPALHVARCATYWHLSPEQVERGLLVIWLIEHDKLGKDDRN